jgi:hypothetical protein
MAQENAMANAGISRGPNEPASRMGADLLVAIPVLPEADALSALAARLRAAAQTLQRSYSMVLAVPGESGAGAPASLPEELTEWEPGSFSVQTFPATTTPNPAGISWLAHQASLRPIAAMASAIHARLCVSLDPDLALNPQAMPVSWLALLLEPALEGGFDLTMPWYASGPYDELVTRSILSPLIRTLYGPQVENPLGTMFAASAQLFPLIANDSRADSVRHPDRQPIPAVIAASRGLRICQVRMGARPHAAESIDLSEALAQLAGPLFLEMEETAAVWQRMRGSHQVPCFGAAVEPDAATSSVDVRHFVEAFQLGVRNLREIWTGILPPVTLLELKKLSLLPVDQFRMPDALWARIVYDFALAHRLRTIRRNHLFGALTPLYLGWVASYAAQVNSAGVSSARALIEQLARTFDSEKAYLVSRWRWPDRFQP